MVSCNNNSFFLAWLKTNTDIWLITLPFFVVEGSVPVCICEMGSNSFVCPTYNPKPEIRQIQRRRRADLTVIVIYILNGCEVQK